MESTITLAHGSGGRLTNELIEQVFLAAFDDEAGRRLEDSAVLAGGPGRVALTTDAFVVKPRVFPGGDIGTLSICGTVNDLPCGAVPEASGRLLWDREGMPIAELKSIAASMASCAKEAACDS